MNMNNAIDRFVKTKVFQYPDLTSTQNYVKSAQTKRSKDKRIADYPKIHRPKQSVPYLKPQIDLKTMNANSNNANHSKSSIELPRKSLLNIE